MVIIFFQFFDSPMEKNSEREIKQLTSQYELINDKLTQTELVLDDIQKRDDNIYRLILKPILFQSLFEKLDMVE